MKKTMKWLFVLLVLFLLTAALAATAAADGYCTREQFQAWYEAAKQRLIDQAPDHILGPDGDILAEGRVYTIIMPGETVGILPSYGLDRDYEYSIQGGIMAFHFTIYQFDEAKPYDEEYEFHRNTLPRTSLPERPNLTPLNKPETLPIPYGARIGLDYVVPGSVTEYQYESMYKNNTGLPIVLKSNAMGDVDEIRNILGQGGNPSSSNSFQGFGNIYHKPVLFFFENEYKLILEPVEYSDYIIPDPEEPLYWRDGTPTGDTPVTLMFKVDNQMHTYEFQNPIKKGCEFDHWMVKDYGNWFWGYLASADSRTISRGPWEDCDCYSSKFSDDSATTSVSFNVLKAIKEHDEENGGYLQVGVKDITFVPFFVRPQGEKDCLTLGFNPQGGTIYGKDYYLCETKGKERRFSVDVGTIMPERSGYNFAGWCTDPDDPENTLIKDTDPENSEAWRKQGHTELYAVWETSKTSIKKAKVTVKNQVYTGKALKPDATVKLRSTMLVKGKDYTVTYKNNKSIGTATVTVKGKGKYTGTVKAAFDIVPKAVTLSKLESEAKGRLKVTWQKSSGITGYEIEYGLKKNLKNATSIEIGKKKTNVTIKDLKSKKTWYVRIRAYKTVKGKKYYSAWSETKKIKVK